MIFLNRSIRLICDTYPPENIYPSHPNSPPEADRSTGGGQVHRRRTGVWVQYTHFFLRIGDPQKLRSQQDVGNEMRYDFRIFFYYEEILYKQRSDRLERSERYPRYINK
jgi:hypothetical protein